MRPESCLEEHGIIVQHSDGQERRWMANERALSNVTEAANQVMNIDNTTWTYTKGTSGAGIPPLVAHVRAVDTRRSFFSLPPPRPSERLDTRLVLDMSCDCVSINTCKMCTHGVYQWLVMYMYSTVFSIYYESHSHAIQQE